MAIKDFVDLDKIQEEINKTFEKLNESMFGNYKRPSINISQNSSQVIVNIEMKGLAKEDIILKVHHNGLEVIGEKKSRDVKKTNKEYAEKSSYRGYKAFVGLPSNINIDEMKAGYKKDTLRVTIPKMKTRLGKKIEIK